MLNKILIVLIILATTLIIWIIYSFGDLVRYKECTTTPISELPAWCKEV